MNEKENEMKMQKETTQEKKQMKQCVYCGPTVRGVARQYEVYSNGIPEALEEFFKAHPVAKALLVPVDSFARTRANLEKAGTSEAVIFNQIKKEL